MRKFIFKLITILLFASFTSSSLHAANRTMAQNAKEAFQFFKALQKAAKDKGEILKLEENKLLQKNVLKDLEANDVFCITGVKTGSRLFKTFMNTFAIELGLGEDPSENAINSFTNLFESSTFGIKKSFVCDDPFNGGRRFIFVSGDRKYSLEVVHHDR